DDDLPGVRVGEEGIRARLCLSAARAGRPKHHPVHMDARGRLEQPKDCTPTPDLDVVAVPPQAQQVEARPASRNEADFEHPPYLWVGGGSVSRALQTSHGALPSLYMSVST